MVDEASMVPRDMAEDMLSFGKPVIVVGDPYQLPPVSGDSYFTAGKPDYMLTQIHRNAGGIVEIATMMREGRLPQVGIYGDTGDARVFHLTKETQPYVYQPETYPICGLNRVRWVYSQRIRRIRGFGGELPQEGERVQCKRNMKDLGIFNGQSGTLLTDPRRCEKYPGLIEIDVQMDGEKTPRRRIPVHPYLFSQHFHGPCQKPRLSADQAEFDWGWVRTAHSAQGSEAPDVTVVDDSRAFRDMWLRWLYTSTTRAQAQVTVLLRPN